MTASLPTANRMSGGEIEGLKKERFETLRRLITTEADVHQLHALLPAHTADSERWLYFIETPFATFPRFVIGETDQVNASPTILFQSGTFWTAADHWQSLTKQIR